MRAASATLAGVPVLVARPHVRPAHPLPTVLWCHGFRADALAHAAQLEQCAQAGFLAVGIDAVGHGARREHDLDARINRMGGALPIMLQQVEQTVGELPAVIETLVEYFDADRTRVSMVGISMGAFLAYRALGAAVPLRAVVALLGSPEWPGDTSAHLAPERLSEAALLSITAEHDASVPPAAVVRLHATLDERFGRRASRRHDVLAGAGHLTSDAEWARAMAATMQWLATHGRSHSVGR